VKAEIGSDLPNVIDKPVKPVLISRIAGRANAALAEAGYLIEREIAEGGIGIVAARPLDELLGRNELPAFKPEFQGVVTFNPGYVVSGLVQVLYCELRGVGIRADVESAQFGDRNVREGIKSREKREV